MKTVRNNKKDRERNAASSVAYNEKSSALSVAEYRKLMSDNTTPDERIQERIDYLTFFTRKVAQGELKKYVKGILKN